MGWGQLADIVERRGLGRFPGGTRPMCGERREPPASSAGVGACADTWLARVLFGKCHRACSVDGLW